MSTGEHRLALPAGYELGKYRFREVLGSGGFGITYLAEDRTLNRRVAVKELLPNDIATRVDGTTVAAKTKGEEESLTWARERFVNEGRALAACDHPNVVHVYEMVEANGTAYMVTKFEEGRSLERWLKDLGRTPTEDELRGILMPLLSGLDRVHSAGFLHRDIKPDNIYLTSNGRPVLLDFGSARQAVSNRSMAMTSIVTSGYAPFEQYYEDGNQGAWSDIYAMGAVMYRAIVGKKPPESTRRLKDDPCERLAVHYTVNYSSQFLKAIDKALAVNESKRPQSVAEWRTMLGDDMHDAATIMHHKERRQEPEGFALVMALLKSRPWIAPAAGVGAAVIVACLAVWAFSKPDNNHNNNGGKPIASVTPSPAASSTPRKIVNNDTSPAPTASVAPSLAPQPTATPIAIVPEPTAAPNVSPTPPMNVIVTPTPALDVPTSQTPTPGPAIAPTVDPQLVGSWQTGATRAKRLRWDVWADGHWVSSGLVTDGGTMTATDGHLRQLSNNTQQSLDSSYEFQGDTLVTHNQLGTAEWHRITNNTASNSPTPKHKSSSGNDSSTHRSSSGNGNGEVGRQILNRFFNRGF